jgi:hypothetical protein
VRREEPDVEQLVARLARWQQLFSPDKATYSLDGYENLYAGAPEQLLAYDNYAERDTRWTGFDRYRAIWEREINENSPASSCTASNSTGPR